ncbi:Tubulin-specific chaperone A, partial [Nibea albiflora]
PVSPSLPVLVLVVVVRRLAKEEISYKTEAKQQEEKVERLKAEAGDEYVIKKQVCESLCIRRSSVSVSPLISEGFLLSRRQDV